MRDALAASSGKLLESTVGGEETHHRGGVAICKRRTEALQDLDQLGLGGGVGLHVGNAGVILSDGTVPEDVPFAVELRNGGPGVTVSGRDCSGCSVVGAFSAEAPGCQRRSSIT